MSTVVGGGRDPNTVILQAAAGAVNVFEAAAKESSVTRFVYTSSAVAVAFPYPNTEFHVDATSWNDAALKLARAPPPYEANRATINYMASKVEVEKAIWQFIENKSPSFTVNTVLPNMVFGTVLSKHQSGSTAG
jgi:nucleoside-diphosphate-sugar epimerase